jgi:hypothetical protein
VYKVSAELEKKFSNDRNLRLSLITGQDFPGVDQQLVNLNTINDGFSINLSAPTPELVVNRSATLFFNKTDEVKLTNLNVNFVYRQQRNAPTFDGFFRERIVFNKIGYGINRNAFVLSTSYSWFISKLKSNLKIRYTSGISESALRLEEETIAIGFLSNTLTFDGTLLLHPRVRLITRIAYRNQYQLGEKQTFTTTSGTGKIFFQTGAVRLFASYNHVRVGNGVIGRYSDGTYLGADKKIKIGGNELLLKANIFNPLNRKTYQNQTLGESFIYTSTVGALSRFIQVSADFTI